MEGKRSRGGRSACGTFESGNRNKKIGKPIASKISMHKTPRTKWRQVLVTQSGVPSSKIESKPLLFKDDSEFG